MKIRSLKIGDFKKGFLDTLESLSSVEGLTVKEAENVYRKIKNKSAYRIIVAEEKGMVVGVLTLLIEQKFIHHGGLAGHIEDVAVKKEWQRKGIGSKLVIKAVAIAKKEKCYKVLLNCHGVKAKFYEKNGFKKSGLEMRLAIK